MDYDKQKLMDNIYFLIQEREIKIGELENEIGVSTGYISRLNKNPESAVSVELAWKIAKFFGVSIDMMIEGNLSKVKDNLQFMGRFINALKDKTDANELEWDSIRIEDINEKLREPGSIDFPIIGERKDGSEIKQMCTYEYQGNICSGMAYRKKVLKSAAVPNEMVAVVATAYKADIDNETEIYIFPMLAINGEQHGNEKEYFDLYMKKWEVLDMDNIGDVDFSWTTYPLCNTLNNANDLENQIKLLYKAITCHEGDLRIDQSVRNTMKSFMGII